MSDDDLDDEGLSWVCMVDPRGVLVISRGPSSLPECLSLSVRRWPDVGVTNEIKTLALFPSSPEIHDVRPIGVHENIC